MEAFRSKVILVECILRNVNSAGRLNPANSALELTDSELIYTGNTEFIVWCDPMIQVCPPDIRLMGSSTMDLRIEDTLFSNRSPGVFELEFHSFTRTGVIAMVFNFPARPFDLPEGTLYLDLATSLLFYLGPNAFNGILRFPFSVPDTGNRIGLPVTFQAVIFENGQFRLSSPFTLVL